MDPQAPDAPLSAAQVAEFRDNGVLVLRGFYDLCREIEPIQRALHQIIGLCIARHGLPIAQPPCVPAEFDQGYEDVIGADRAIGGEIYDAAKQVPAFVRLAVSPRHDAILAQLRHPALPGVAAGGFGIRIDNPFEDRYRANWHQEYPAQLRSIDGLVFWSPLVPVTEEMGPVQVCPGSHREGPVPVHLKDPSDPQKTGAYALRLADEERRLARYPVVSLPAAPGDLVLMDFLTLHASGHNRGRRSRWTMQTRYFNFRDPTGQRIGWKGSFAASEDFRKYHPELVAD
jgi:hypothetical protein